MKRRCVSSPLSLKNTLTSIYGHLRHPRDMRSFMLVNKLFHKAGAEWGGYGGRIEKLLERCGGKYPFKDEFLLQYQYFFALCFISCKTDEELSEKIFKCFKEERYIYLALYCRNILGYRVTTNGYYRFEEKGAWWIIWEKNTASIFCLLRPGYLHLSYEQPISVIVPKEFQDKCAEI